jgi:Ca-activated chloride channel homolog
MRMMRTIQLITILLILTIFFAGCEKNEYSFVEAATEIKKIAENETNWRQMHIKNRVKLDTLNKKKQLFETLPKIDIFPTPVNPIIEGTIVEVFCSTEKCGKGRDGFLVEMAKKFNSANIEINGKKALVRLRSIASGTAYQYIASRKHLPDAYSPSNVLWVKMANAAGIETTLVEKQLVKNLAGIVIKKETSERIEETYGKLTIPNLIDSVVQGNTVMGYVNPFASSTGLNFLVTVLAKFSNGDESKFLDDDVVSGFTAFQQGVPFVAMTTLQLRESVENDNGTLDAFPMEWQTYVNVSQLQSGYDFLPFGISHDNPLYAIGSLSEEKMAVLKAFGKYVVKNKIQATDAGFFPDLKHKSEYSINDGKTLVAAQELWKEKKDSGRPIAAVFLADVSGSMSGEPISKLKKALSDGFSFINKNNYVGLVAFSAEVTELTPIERYGNINHSAALSGAVKSLTAGGNTAMYEGIAVSLHLLAEKQKQNQDIKPLLFVLTDGKASKSKVTLERLTPIIKALRIPVYTIGYGIRIEELKTLSSLVEAASLNANSENISFSIGKLLNAEL